MINEQCRKFSKKKKKFQLATFEEAVRNEEVQERHPEGLHTAACNIPVLLLCLTVNRWLVLIDGCLPAQLNTNERCIWLSCVNSSEHQHPSVTINFVITHQMITAAIHWQWF